MNTMIRPSRWTPVALVFAALLLSACASNPINLPELDGAQAAVDAVVADAQVREHARAELQEAEALLKQTRTRWQEGAERPELLHLVQLTETQADIARERARLRALEARVDGLSNQREVLRVEARAARAERQAREAADARSRAEAERLAEAARRARAEQAAREAELQRSEEALRRELAQQEALAAHEQRAEAERQLREMELEAERMREAAERMQQQIAELEARPTDRGLVLTLGGDVLFDLNQHDLRDGAMRTMDRIAEFLNEYEDRKILVEGFTDSTGTRDYNLELSDRRASSVRSALIDRGVDPDRIRTQGYGPDYPVASNESAAGRQLNRRVEVIISDDHENVPGREN